MHVGRFSTQDAAAWRLPGLGSDEKVVQQAAAAWPGDRWNPSEPTGGAGVKAPKPAVVSMPSPNQSSRPAGTKIDTIVLHHTAGGGTAQGVGNFFKNASAQVSSHYIVGKDGTIVQPVPDAKAAWHAGVSEFKGRERVNDFSIGIEIVNRGDGKDPYTDAQYKALARLVAYLQTEHGIPRSRITGHKDVARPRGRKIDPSPNFSYERLNREVEAIMKGERPKKPERPKPSPDPGRVPKPKPDVKPAPKPEPSHAPAPAPAPVPAPAPPPPVLAPAPPPPAPIWAPPPLAPVAPLLPPPPAPLPPPMPVPAPAPPVVQPTVQAAPSPAPALAIDPQATATIGQLLGQLAQIQAVLDQLIATYGQPGATPLVGAPPMHPAPTTTLLGPASMPAPVQATASVQAPLPVPAPAAFVAPALPLAPAGAAVASVPG